MYSLLLLLLLTTITAITTLINKKRSKPALQHNQFIKVTLQAKTYVSPNTSIYRFKLNNQHDYLGLPTGQHIIIQADINGKQIQRMYTPVTSDQDKGYFELIIKTYDQGNISKYIANLAIVEHIMIKGPRGQMKYQPELATHLGMIAGGTGITPMLQIIRAAVSNPKDHTKISLIYANVNPEDILLKHELDHIQTNHPEQFSVYYVLNNPPKEWDGGAGFVTKQMIADKLPPAKLNKHVKILLCGPPPMTAIMKKYLEELEFEKCRVISKIDDQVFCF